MYIHIYTHIYVHKNTSQKECLHIFLGGTKMPMGQWGSVSSIFWGQGFWIERVCLLWPECGGFLKDVERRVDGSNN